MESAFIWDFCGKSFEKASCQRFRINDNEINPVNDVSSQDTTVIEMCALVDFLLDIVSIETYVETASEHLPNLFKSREESVAQCGIFKIFLSYFPKLMKITIQRLLMYQNDRFCTFMKAEIDQIDKNQSL